MSEMSKDVLVQSLEALTERVEALEAEADIRRVQARYMFLCDTPCPEYGVENDAQRIERSISIPKMRCGRESAPTMTISSAAASARRRCASILRVFGARSAIQHSCLTCTI